ncbi:hypothetical protein BDU57DRAFT_517448 [Ampelomyces quisqualis]|uniref:Uncharacterized protein n=1 Tax=Ampelomyces quisqualis TaxID=50730 RepID=A0A6A5QNN6_AMPQU|nr:hypothetical protein BDU57DRAFT_517448 [Ampelomyces quisqualis]
MIDVVQHGPMPTWVVVSSAWALCILCAAVPSLHSIHVLLMVCVYKSQRSCNTVWASYVARQPGAAPRGLNRIGISVM